MKNKCGRCSNAKKLKGQSYCRPCKNDWQKDHRIKTDNSSTRKYEKTISGFLVRCYRNMLSRVTGVQHQKFHLYQGKSILPREVFYSWALNSERFLQLFETWRNSNFARKITPSVDRINPSKGYELTNMEWVTHSENSRRSSETRYEKKKQA
jgi:hypothetical protein